MGLERSIENLYRIRHLNEDFWGLEVKKGMNWFMGEGMGSWELLFFGFGWEILIFIMSVCANLKRIEL